MKRFFGDRIERHGLSPMLVGSMNAAEPYLGAIATRCSMPNEKAGSGVSTAYMARTYHYSRDTITSIAPIIGNFYGASEKAMGGPATVTASIEYPEGTFTQVLFGGMTSGTVPDGGMLVADQTTVSIPDNTKFWVRVYYTNSAGFCYNGRRGDTANGDVLAWSGVTDKTMSNPMPTNGASNFCAFPIGLIGMTTKASVMLIGDSRQFGYADVATGSTGDAGECARSIGPDLAYINGGISGETTTAWNAKHTNRLALSGYCTHVVCQYGINDIVGGSPAATVYAALATIEAQFSGQPFYVCTLPPVSTSTDSWATAGNQTTHANNAARVTFNGSIRSNSNGHAGYFEIADQVESARDSGLWQAGYTTDGTHETNTANLAIQSSGAVDIEEFTYP